MLQGKCHHVCVEVALCLFTVQTQTLKRFYGVVLVRGKSTPWCGIPKAAESVYSVSARSFGFVTFAFITFELDAL